MVKAKGKAKAAGDDERVRAFQIRELTRVINARASELQRLERALDRRVKEAHAEFRVPLTALEAERNAALANRAQIACPYVVGQPLFMLRFAHNSWHGGRSRGAERVIEGVAVHAIEPIDDPPFYSVAIVGFLKDGSPGKKQIRRWRQGVIAATRAELETMTQATYERRQHA